MRPRLHTRLRTRTGPGRALGRSSRHSPPRSGTVSLRVSSSIGYSATTTRRSRFHAGVYRPFLGRCGGCKVAIARVKLKRHRGLQLGHGLSFENPRQRFKRLHPEAPERLPLRCARLAADQQLGWYSQRRGNLGGHVCPHAADSCSDLTSGRTISSGTERLPGHTCACGD